MVHLLITTNSNLISQPELFIPNSRYETWKAFQKSEPAILNFKFGLSGLQSQLPLTTKIFSRNETFGGSSIV